MSATRISGYADYDLTEAKIDAVKPNIGLTNKGSFTCDSSVNKAIAHGLPVKPSLVFIQMRDAYSPGIIIEDGFIHYNNQTTNYRTAVTPMDDTNFYVGNASNYTISGNGNTKVICGFITL